MAFVPFAPLPSPSRSASQRGRVCRMRPRAEATPPPKPTSLPSEEPSPKKLTRNIPGEVVASNVEFAEPFVGEAGGPEGGEDFPYTVPVDEKKASPAAEAQGYMTFADAWASQNRDSGKSRFGMAGFCALQNNSLCLCTAGLRPAFTDYARPPLFCLLTHSSVM